MIQLIDYLPTWLFVYSAVCCLITNCGHHWFICCLSLPLPRTADPSPNPLLVGFVLSIKLNTQYSSHSDPGDLHLRVTIFTLWKKTWSLSNTVLFVSVQTGQERDKKGEALSHLDVGSGILFRLWHASPLLITLFFGFSSHWHLPVIFFFVSIKQAFPQTPPLVQLLQPSQEIWASTMKILLLLMATGRTPLLYFYTNGCLERLMIGSLTLPTGAVSRTVVLSGERKIVF